LTNGNKAKAKDKTAKKEEKSKSEEPKPNVDETLPLWWTDKTAAAPGTPAAATCANGRSGYRGSYFADASNPKF